MPEGTLLAAVRVAAAGALDPATDIPVVVAGGLAVVFFILSAGSIKS